jgi:hypothetical protein
LIVEAQACIVLAVDIEVVGGVDVVVVGQV